VTIRRVAILCDAGPLRGIGHVMRCVALGEELASRDITVDIVADVADVPWAAAAVTNRGFALHARVADDPGLADALLGPRPDAVVIDSYITEPGVSRAIRAAGVPVLAIVDGTRRGQSGDVYLDQNLGAETDPWPYGNRLAGLRYVLLRDAVRSARPGRPSPRGAVAVPRVLAHFGGTDPFGAAPLLAHVLASTGAVFHATVVAPDALAASVRAVPLGTGQRLDVIGLVDDLPTRAARADLVICASGTSVWEMLCVGAATAVTWVVDNQQVGYERVVASGAVTGLGELDAIRRDPAPAIAAVAALLSDAGARDRMRSTAWALVDGDGRTRVADTLTAIRPLRRDPSSAVCRERHPIGTSDP
jgi:spore coat polysaccharide biosynthesis predicted glycosyltransferase SpsG